MPTTEARTADIDITVDDKVVGTVAGEFIPLDYADMPLRADPAIGMAGNGTIYAAIHERIFVSNDGGRTWSAIVVDIAQLNPPAVGGYDSFGVLRDGTLLWAYSQPAAQTIAVARSSDGGKTWADSVMINKSPFDACGGNQNCMTELSDGTILYPCRVGPVQDYLEQVRVRGDVPYDGKPFFHCYVFRSSDGGDTWSQKNSLQDWGTETSLVELNSGKLVAAIRYQRHGPAGSPIPDYEPPDLAQIDAGEGGIVGKRVFLADSADGGLTWSNFRYVRRETGGSIDLPYGDAHGQLLQLADDRVVLTFDHRYPYEQTGVWARLSCDEAETWRPEIYQLSRGAGYGASVVTDDGTIVSVCGNSPLDVKKADIIEGKCSAQIVCWRPLY